MTVEDLSYIEAIKCQWENCDKCVYEWDRVYCSMHLRAYNITEDKCIAENCNEPARYGRINCDRHAYLLRKYGKYVLDKVCNGCGNLFLWTTNKNSGGGNWCLSCNEIRKAIPKSYFGQAKAHGLTILNVIEIHEFQKFKCKLCNHFPIEKIGYRARAGLELDHNHNCCPTNYSATNKRTEGCGRCIRGLLCQDCNRMISGYENCKGNLEILKLDEYCNVDFFVFSTPIRSEIEDRKREISS